MCCPYAPKPCGVAVVARVPGEYELAVILPVLVFRGAPGAMASRAQDFCYIDCTLGPKQFEIHVDVIYEGQSGANHEIDVSICLRSHAQDIRGSGRTPRTNKNLIAAIECKFYESLPAVDEWSVNNIACRCEMKGDLNVDRAGESGKNLCSSQSPRNFFFLTLPCPYTQVKM